MVCWYQDHLIWIGAGYIWIWKGSNPGAHFFFQSIQFVFKWPYPDSDHLTKNTLFTMTKNRYEMVHFTKEIMMLLGASLAVMWFPSWLCLLNMHFSVQCTRCRWPEGIQSEKSSLAIMCCLPHQKVQFKYVQLKPVNVMTTRAFYRRNQHRAQARYWKTRVAKRSWWCLGIIPSNRCCKCSMINSILEEIHL